MQATTNIATASTVTDKPGLIATLMKKKGASIVSMTTSVEPRMRKTGNPYVGRVRKVSRVNGMVGWNYTNSVNNQRERENKTADFEAHPRTWGTRVKGTPFVAHEGKVYLELKVENVFDTAYMVDGAQATPEQVKEIKSFITSKPESARQQVDREIILRDYNLDTIQEITAYGESYTVLHPATVPATEGAVIAKLLQAV